MIQYRHMVTKNEINWKVHDMLNVFMFISIFIFFLFFFNLFFFWKSIQLTQNAKILYLIQWHYASWGCNFCGIIGIERIVSVNFEYGT